MSDWQEGNQERRQNDREPADLGWIKKALVTSCLALLANFAGGIWWAATQTAKMDFVQNTITAIQQDLKDASNDRYRGADALKDFTVINSRIDRVEGRVVTLERSLNGRLVQSMKE